MVAAETRNQVPSRNLVSLVVAFLVLSSTSAVLYAQSNKSFALPPSGPALWEAEQAVPSAPAPKGAIPHWLSVRDPRASGNAYVEVQPPAKEHVLEFPFQVDRDTVLQVRPVWWLHGERKPARRFPAPFPSQPGPDVIDACGDLLFFTSPATGRVCVLDPKAEKVVKAIEIGGYPMDMIADRANHLLYVADAKNDRVCILDAADQKPVGDLQVPAFPCSLALSRRSLYVACLAAKRLVVIDTETTTISKTVPLSIAPISVEADEKNKRIILRPLPRLFEPGTLQERPPDDVRYTDRQTRSVPFGASGAPNAKRFTAPKPHAIVMRTKAAPKDKIIDVSAVTGGPGAPASLPPDLSQPPFRPEAGPDVMDACRNLLFFTSPVKARVGVLDMKTDKLVKTLEVGGYPSDLIVGQKTGKVYVADPVGNRVVVIDPRNLVIVKEIPIPGMPWSLAAFEGDSIFVGCRKAKCIVQMDGLQDKVIRTVALDVEPAQVFMTTPPNKDWWPLLPDERIPEALRPRLVVRAAPVILDLAALSPVEKAVAPADAPKRQKVALPPGAAAATTYSVDDNLVIRIDTTPKRSIDVSDFTDPQQVPETAALSPKDSPGTITFALDGSPELDWTRSIWMTPDQELFLVNETDEFWRWNAPCLTVKAGAHVLKVRAHSPYAALDALSVSCTLRSRTALAISPVSQASGSAPSLSPLLGWRSVFYDQEPAAFHIQVSADDPAPRKLTYSYTIRNYMDEVVAKGEKPLELAAAPVHERLEPALKDWGIFTLTVVLDSPDGTLVTDHRFLRLPKLDHPRLLLRKEDIPAVKARIKAHPLLYKRFADWLRRECEQGNFVPKGFTVKTVGDILSYRLEHRVTTQPRVWREYELAWRALACQFAAVFLESPNDTFFASRIAPLLNETQEDSYCMFHHHGPFFPGAVASFFDIAAMDSEEGRQRIQTLYAAKIGDMNVFPWTIAAIEEPLTPERRALLFRIAMWSFNWQRYFETHCGTRGGLWWQNPRTDCHCQTAGYVLSSLYLRQLFKEDRFFQKDFYRGFFAFHDYWHPRYDNKGLLCGSSSPKPYTVPGGPPPNLRPFGEPARWIGAVLSNQPIEAFLYGWDPWVARLDSGFFGPGLDEVEQMFRRQGAVCVPIALALGWYTPPQQQVRWDELPPTALFNVDGMAAMRSGWTRDLTEIVFSCGARDHGCRHQPTNLRISKAGEVLLGSLALEPDHGNAIPSWGNVVVVGSDWPARWKANTWQCRADEYFIIDRFSPPTWQYLARDAALAGFIPAERGWGGGMDFHGHTESAFVKEGLITAYETWPGFDYVAGDATNAWPVDQVSDCYRQVVYLKPDTLVIYDRVGLRSALTETAWIAATAPSLTTEDAGFAITSAPATLQAAILLPPNPIITTQASATYKELAWSRQPVPQRVIEVRPAATSAQAEYLVVMKLGLGKPVLSAKLALTDASAGAQFDLDGRKTEVAFARKGMPGGKLSIGPFRHDFVQKTDDSYRRYSSDPRYPKWISEDRFRFIITEADRKASAQKN